jgi:hypothetical protein
VKWVFGNVTEALRKQLVTFWIEEGAIHSPNEAWRRCWEVARILQDAGGGMAGDDSHGCRRR